MKWELERTLGQKDCDKINPPKTKFTTEELEEILKEYKQNDVFKRTNGRQKM